jgi:hypothetical protein
MKLGISAVAWLGIGLSASAAVGQGSPVQLV